MLVIGAHLTIANGFTNAANTALKIGGNTFQFFSRNPRGSNFKAYNDTDITEFQRIRNEFNFGPIQAHAPYTMNLASTDDKVYKFANEVIKEDIKRMDALGIEYFNLHPGNHVGNGFDVGISQIAKGLNQGITGNEHIMILLETMSGKGTEVGSKFEHIKKIIDMTEHSNKLGVCMDLCHIFSSGYDIKNRLDDVLEEFDKVIGLDRLKTIHLNDSMMPLGERKDRHITIGEGFIGLDSILNIMSHPYIKNLPFYLETPLEDEGHKREITMLKELLYPFS